MSNIIFFLFFYFFFIPSFYSVGIITGIRRSRAYLILSIVPLSLLLFYFVGFPFFKPTPSDVSMLRSHDLLRDSREIRQEIRDSFGGRNLLSWERDEVKKLEEELLFSNYEAALIRSRGATKLKEPKGYDQSLKDRVFPYFEEIKRKALEKYVYSLLSYISGLVLGITGFLRIRELSLFVVLGSFCSFLGEFYWKFKVYIRRRAIDLTSNDFRFGDGEGFFTDGNLSLHTQVVGGSGVGKTNFLKNFITDRVSKGRGLIFLDFKADFEVLEWMKGLMVECGREDFKCLMLSRPESSIPYNPIQNGTSTEITSQLMNSFLWSEEFYKNYSENVLLMTLNILCYLRDEENEYFHLGHLYKALSSSSFRKNLLDRSQRYEYIEEVNNTFSVLESKKGAEGISGLLIQLKKIIFSSAGKILTSNVEDFKSLDFRESIENGEVVYVFMNSMSLKDVASTTGKMILQDLMKEVGKIYDSEEAVRNNTSIIIDEFASFATPDFVGFIDKARGANIELMISHQSMADLREISDNFGTRIFENTASKVIFNTQSTEDAEYFSGSLGTFETIEDTEQIEKGFIFNTSGTETGLGSRRVVEKFKIHPNIFKELVQGEAVVMGSKVDVHFGKTSIFRACDFGRVEGDLFSLEKSTQNYLSFEESGERVGSADSIDSI